MIREMRDFIRKFICTDAEEKFKRHNRMRWDTPEGKKNSIILLERASYQHCILSWSYFANYLRKMYDADIYTYSYKESIPNRALNSIYQSFGSQGNVQEILTAKQQARAKEICKNLFLKCKSKQDWYNASVLDLNVGIDIYETYLSLGNPTLDSSDTSFRNIVKVAIEKVVFWNDNLEKMNVKTIMVSHDCYLGNIIRRVANKKCIPVYQITTGWGVKLEDGFSCGDRFRFYHELFQQLPAEEQIEGIAWAKRQLNRRFAGEVGVDMLYSKKSSFDEVDHKKRVLKRGERIKVLICPHCFYDNPNVYGKHLFLDFYDWLCYLGELSFLTDYDWYIKLHPDFRMGEMEIIHDIIKKYPKFSLIGESVSHKQLAYEGLDFALTVHGTIACEYPLLGVQVINAGNNPHVAYDFSWTPTSLPEYQEWLLNLDKLHKDINPEEIYEFYCVHHIYGNYNSKMRGRDDLIFSSENKALKELEKKKFSSLFAVFLNEIDDVRHEEIKENVDAYYQQMNSYKDDEIYIR